MGDAERNREVNRQEIYTVVYYVLSVPYRDGSADRPVRQGQATQGGATLGAVPLVPKYALSYRISQPLLPARPF